MRIALACLFLGGCATTFNGQPVERMTAMSAIAAITVALIVADDRNDDASDKGFGCRTCPPPELEDMQ